MVSNNEMDLHYDITKTKDGHLIGQCLEFPSAIAYAKTEESLDQQMIKCMHGYFDAFPVEEYPTTEEPQKQIKHISGRLFAE